MEWVETTGNTVNEAVETALDQLGVHENDAQIEIISEPKTGIFGRIRSEARVRARVKPIAPRPKDDGPRRRRKQSSAGSGDNVKAKRKSESQGRSSAADEPSEKDPAVQGSVKRREKNSGGAQKVDNPVPLGIQGNVASEFLQGLVERVEPSASLTMSVDEEDEVVLISIEGSDLGHLIGPKGNTLHALQELTRTVVQRKTGARSGRIIVDVLGYREKRREALMHFSREVAQEVIQQDSERALEPMNPADRKVVHDTVNQIDGVETSSEGEEPRRRIIIRPRS